MLATMPRKLSGSLSLALLLACNGGGAASTGDDPTGEGPTSGTVSTGADPATGGGSTQVTSDSPTGEVSSGGATGEPGCEDADSDGFGAGCAGGDDCDDGVATCTQDCSDADGNGVPECAEAPGTGVMLFTGANGGGPPTDLYVDSLASLYTKAGFVTETTDSFPADFVKTTGTMLLLNPLDPLPEKVLLGARALLLRGGRVVLIMEHCKGGCYGNAAGDNAFLEALGSSLRLSGEGGAPLSETPLTLAAAPPTQGLTTVMAYYSGSVMVGDGLALGAMDGGAGDVVLGYETLYNGDIVVAADSSIFGYMLDQADNSAFVVGLAGPLLGG
jgi:hypothetical protein